MRSIVALSLCGVMLVAACSPGPPTEQPTPTPVATGAAGLEVVLVMPDGGSPLPVRLFDETGLVLELAAVPFGVVPVPEGLSNPAGVKDVLLLSWVGGACDTSTTLTLDRRGEGFRLTLSTATAPGACIAIGLVRQVSIRLAEPVDAASVVLVTT